MRHFELVGAVSNCAVSAYHGIYAVRFLTAPTGGESVLLFLTSTIIEIVAYCLMPNHYHILAYLKDDNLSKEIMQPFTISYTKAVNRQQGRVGPVFQGAFRAKLVDKNEYLLHLSRYIHLNPVLAGIVDNPASWKFSSYQDYIGLRDGTLSKPDIVLSQFPSRPVYAKFVNAYSETDREFIEHLMLD